MKVHHISTYSYESYMVDALCRSMTDKQGTLIEYKHDICKKDGIVGKLDNDFEVLILTGFALDGVEDTELIKQVRIDYGVPFTEMFVVGAMNNLPAVPAFHEFNGSSDISAVKEFYDYLVGGNTEFIAIPEGTLREAVNLYNSYNLYNFTGRDQVNVLAQKHLADSFKFNFGKILAKYGDDWVSDETLSLLCNTATLEMLSYMDRHARWVEWRVVQLPEGDYLTLGVVSAERYKNELAHKLLEMSNTEKAVVVVLEDKGYTQITIRTKNFDAVRVAREVEPMARGKEHASTVFTDGLGRLATQVAGAFESQLSTH